MTLGALGCLTKPEANTVHIQVSLPPLESEDDHVCPCAPQLAAEQFSAAYQEPLPFHSFHLVADARSPAVR